jgi:hypothetical protein
MHQSTQKQKVQGNSRLLLFNQKGEVICSGRGWTIRPT